MVVVVLLVLSGCAQETVLRPGGMGAKSPSTAAGNAAVANPVTAKTVVPEAKLISQDDERVVPGQWKTLYCNLAENDLRREADSIQDDISGYQERLSGVDDEISTAAGAERMALQATKRDVQNSLSATQANFERINAMLADMLAKCKKLDSRKDSKICTEFKTDLTHRIAEAQTKLTKEQTELKFITDSSQLARQQRKILAALQVVERISSVQTDLSGRC